eukprot:364060-Chlamydomonas_euryale.AAC.6
MHREARILARRKRIQERLASLHQGDVGGTLVCTAPEAGERARWSRRGSTNMHANTGDCESLADAFEDFEGSIRHACLPALLHPRERERCLHACT